MNYSKLMKWSRPLSAYAALSGGVNAFGLGGLGATRRGGFGSLGGLGSSGNSPARMLGVGTAGASGPANDLAFSAFNGRAVSIVNAFAYESTWANLHGWVTGGEALRGANYDICWALGFPTTKTFADVNAGTEDANYNQLFDEILAARPSQATIYLRVMPEFQLVANVWYAIGAETAYKAAFIRIVGLARAKSAKFKIIFNPNYHTANYDPMLAYPGDAYVDGPFGMDLYKIHDYGAGSGDGDGITAWNLRLNETYGLTYLYNQAVAHGKAFCFPEWGVDNVNDAPFIQAMAAWVASHNVVFHCYFDVNNGSTHQNQISAYQYGLVADAFIAAFGIAKVRGFAIGEAGTGFRSGFKLSWGEDFNYRFPTWTGGSIAGRYSNSPCHIGFRRESAATADVALYIEPEYRGARNTSPTALGFDAASVSSSVLNVSIQPIPVGLSAFLPTSYTQGGGDGSSKPQLISTAIRTWPTIMFSAAGDFIVECKCMPPAGVARGFWPGPWTSAIFWPDGGPTAGAGEVDICEMVKIGGGTTTSGSANLHISNSDGGPDVSSGIGATGAISTARMTAYAVKKISATNTLEFWDDETTQGTMALKGTYTNARVARLRGAHDMRFDNMVNPSWDSTTFTIGDWPKTMAIDDFMYWAPATAAANTAMNVLTQINTTPGGSWSASVPSNATLFGGTSPDMIEVCAAFDNEDAPGMPTRNSTTKLPNSMTVDMTARTISGTVPATEGGRMGVLFIGSFTAGGPARRAVQYFNVAPVALGTVWTDISGNIGDVVSKVIAYTDFHSGNLGPHTYSAVKTAGGTDFTITGNGTGTLTIAGTIATNETSTFTITCTNSIGQTTVITRNVTIAASFSPGTWAKVVEWWDPNDATTVFSDSAATVPAVVNTDKATAIVGKKLGAVLNNTTSAFTTPTYITDSIKTSIKVPKFLRSALTRLVCTNATVLAVASGNDTPFTIMGAVRRGTAAVSSTPWSFNRTSVQNDWIRCLISGSDFVGMQRGVNNAGTLAVNSSPALNSDAWHVITLHFNGTTLDIRIDGSTVATAVALNVASMTLNQFAWGALFSQALAAWDATTAHDQAIGETMLIDGTVTLGDATLATAESYLMAKYL